MLSLSRSLAPLFSPLPLSSSTTTPARVWEGAREGTRVRRIAQGVSESAEKDRARSSRKSPKDKRLWHWSSESFGWRRTGSWRRRRRRRRRKRVGEKEEEEVEEEGGREREDCACTPTLVFPPPLRSLRSPPWNPPGTIPTLRCTLSLLRDGLHALHQGILLRYLPTPGLRHVRYQRSVLYERPPRVLRDARY